MGMMTLFDLLKKKNLMLTESFELEQKIKGAAIERQLS